MIAVMGDLHLSHEPDPKLKGKKDCNCNRTDCQKPKAEWYNHSTRKWYCEECANWLNTDIFNYREAMEMWGHLLCTHKDDENTIKVFAEEETVERVQELVLELKNYQLEDEPKDYHLIDHNANFLLSNKVQRGKRNKKKKKK